MNKTKTMHYMTKKHCNKKQTGQLILRLSFVFMFAYTIGSRYVAEATIPSILLVKAAAGTTEAFASPAHCFAVFFHVPFFPMLDLTVATTILELMTKEMEICCELSCFGG